MKENKEKFEPAKNGLYLNLARKGSDFAIITATIEGVRRGLQVPQSEVDIWLLGMILSGMVLIPTAYFLAELDERIKK